MAGQLGEEIQTQTPQRVKFCAFRAVLAEAIMQQLLKGLEEQLDVSVASASVGPAPEGIAAPLASLKL